MREMSSEMATLLKSKKMIGDNRAVHEINFGNSSGTYEFWDTMRKIRTDRSYPTLDFGGGHFIKRADGKILVGYVRNNDYKIMLSVVENEDDLFLNDNLSSINEWEFYTMQGNLNYTKFSDRYIVFQNGINGELFMYLLNPAGYNSTFPETLSIYKSNNGLGTDFVLMSTIREQNLDINFSTGMEEIGIGIPIISDGRLLLPWVGNVLYSSYYGQSACFVSYSDDNGITWVNKIIWQGNYIESGALKGIAKFNGQLAVAVSMMYGDMSNYFMVSVNNGESWTLLQKRLYLQGESAIHQRGDSLIYGGNGFNYWMKMDGYNLSFVPRIYVVPSSFTLPTNGQEPYARGEGQFWGTVLNPEYKLGDDGYEFIWITNDNNIAIAGVSHGDEEFILHGGKFKNRSLQAKSININRNRGMSSNIGIVFDNKDGILSPDNLSSEYFQLLKPNTEIVIKQGYGVELVQTFKGLIDSIEMTTFPQEIRVDCRDDLKKALDQTITDIYGGHVIGFMGHTIEYMFTALAQRANLTLGTVEETGIIITEKVFSWETYADCFSWLSELVGFEIVCDEEGITHFRKEQIPDLVVANYTFREGEDIISLGYIINDNDLYSKVIVHGLIKGIDATEGIEGTEDEVIEVIKDFTASVYWNLLPQKILKIDASECDTIAKCEAIADKAIYLMISRARIVQFKSIGIPNLQIGDFIEVVESSTTISEIYRVTDISTNQDASNYTMDITCYWYSHN